MAQAQVMSTVGLAPPQRVKFWNQWAVQALRLPLAIDTAEPEGFWGHIAHFSLDRIHVAEAKSSAAVVLHSARHAARTAPDVFHLLVQLSGRTAYLHGGKDAELAPGDFTLLDCSRPYELTFSEPVAALVVAMHRQQLKTYLAYPETAAGLKVTCASGPAALASRLLCALSSHPEDLTTCYGSPYLEQTIFGILAIAYSQILSVPLENSRSVTRRFQIVRYVEDHLHQVGFNVEHVATAFRVTPRRIHRLFANSGETLGKYIHRRRIEDCARALADPLQRPRTISAIAYDHGFSSIAHFSRVFREHFGSSPSAYRRSRAKAPTPKRQSP